MRYMKHPSIHLLVSVLVTFVLSVVLVTASFAETKSYKPSGGSSNGSKAVEHKITSGGSGRGSSYRPSTSAPSASTRSGGGSRVTVTRDNNRTYRPQTDTRTQDRPGYGTGTQPSPGRHYNTPRVDTHGRTSINSSPRTNYVPSANYTRSYKPSGVTVRTGFRSDHASRVRHYEPPKSYKPPVYRTGGYYYPSHYSRPCSYGYWTFDYYPGFSSKSCYFYYGFFPYVQITRVVHESSYPQIVYVDRPIYTSGGYYLESSKYAALDEALADIRGAWVSGRYDLVERHVSSLGSIAVMLDGRYDYSIEGEDYLAMTRDAVGDLETVSFVWDSVKARSDGSVTAFATHRYYDSSRGVRTVYVSYTLEKYGSEYYITEVGSSLSRLN